MPPRLIEKRPEVTDWAVLQTDPSGHRNRRPLIDYTKEDAVRAYEETVEELRGVEKKKGTKVELQRWKPGAWGDWKLEKIIREEMI